MDSSTLNSLLAGVNTSVNPVFSWGYTAPASLTFAAKLNSKAAFPVIDAERALTLLCAELTGLKLDREIFRGELPERIAAGFYVAFQQEIPCADPDYRIFSATFSGKRILRDSVMERAALLAGKLPLPEIVKISSAKQSKTVALAELLPAKLENEAGAESGRFHFYSGITLKAVFRTN